jgi:hypothetical protein
MKILKGIKEKLNKKVMAVCATMAVAMTTMSVTCFAADTPTDTTGQLPQGVSDMFTNLAKGVVITIGAVAVGALTVYAAPKAILVAKKIFNKVAG